MSFHFLSVVTQEHLGGSDSVFHCHNVMGSNGWLLLGGGQACQMSSSVGAFPYEEAFTLNVSLTAYNVLSLDSDSPNKRLASLTWLSCALNFIYIEFNTH